MRLFRRKPQPEPLEIIDFDLPSEPETPRRRWPGVFAVLILLGALTNTNYAWLADLLVPYSEQGWQAVASITQNDAELEAMRATEVAYQYIKHEAIQAQTAAQATVDYANVIVARAESDQLQAQQYQQKYAEATRDAQGTAVNLTYSQQATGIPLTAQAQEASIERQAEAAQAAYARAQADVMRAVTATRFREAQIVAEATQQAKYAQSAETRQGQPSCLTGLMMLAVVVGGVANKTG